MGRENFSFWCETGHYIVRMAWDAGRQLLIFFGVVVVEEMTMLIQTAFFFKSRHPRCCSDVRADRRFEFLILPFFLHFVCFVATSLQLNFLHTDQENLE